MPGPSFGWSVISQWSGMSMVRHVDGPTCRWSDNLTFFSKNIRFLSSHTYHYKNIKIVYQIRLPVSCILISNLFFHRGHGNVKQVPIAATRVTPVERHSDIIDSHDILERYIRRKLPKYQINPVPGNGKCTILAMQTCLENCGIVHDVETIKNRSMKYLLVWNFTKVFAWRKMVRR